MNRSNNNRPKVIIWAVTLGVIAASLPVMGQEAPGDQSFSFGLRQKFGVADNIRLDSSSAGSTLYSDTALSFGFDTTTTIDNFSFFAEGVGRIVDDPIIGADSGFRDPKVDISYERLVANSRLSVFANYFRPDLVFQDPLQQGNIGSEDFYRGGGTREDFSGGFRLETGLQSPLGLIVDLNSRKTSYSDTTDPLLFSSETHFAGVTAIFRLSNVTSGRINISEERYRAGDVSSTDRDTQSFSFGVDHDFSAIDALSIDFGYSKVVETFDALPGVENTLTSPVGGIAYRRLMPDGVATASLDTDLTSRGRQTTLKFGRVFEQPVGRFEFSLGATAGDSFNARPIGLIAYDTETARGTFNVSLSQESDIDSNLNQATETSRFDMGYRTDLTDTSALSFDVYVASINLVGNNSSGAGRNRASFYASYIYDFNKDWDLAAGYQYKYLDPNVGASASSNGVFLSFQRKFEVSR